MTTSPKNSLTRSGLQLHPEQASPDTNPNASGNNATFDTLRTFEVLVYITEYRRAFVQASSDAEAMEIAERSDLENSVLYDMEFSAVSAEEVEDHSRPEEPFEEEVMEGGCDE